MAETTRNTSDASDQEGTPHAGIGVGRPYGYGGDDVVGAPEAYLRGEVSSLHRTPEEPVALEIRVHGVGGATAETNLGTPHTLQVAGDSSAGFYRSWYPGQQAPVGKRLEHETYCWGKLDYKSWASALWTLLLPLALVNLAHSMLPAKLIEGRAGGARALLRLLALLLTAAYVSTFAYLFVDLVAYQAGRDGAALLPSKVQFLPDLSGWLYTAALLAVLLCVLGLRWLSTTTSNSYEAWDGEESGDERPAMRLGQKGFWDAKETLDRQRYVHLVMASAVVLYYAGLVLSGEQGPRGEATIAKTVAEVFAGLSALVAVTPALDRQSYVRKPSTEPKVNSLVRPLLATWSWAAVAAAAAAALATARVPLPTAYPRALPGDLGLQSLLFVAEMGIVGLLLVRVALTRSRTAQGRDEVFLRGLAAPVVALLAVLVTTTFGGALANAVANLLGDPVTAIARSGKSGSESSASTEHLALVPWTGVGGGLVLLALVAVGVVIGIVFWIWWTFIAWRSRTVRPRVDVTYPSRTGKPGADGTEAARRVVTRTWAVSRLTEFIARLLAGGAVLALVVLLADGADNLFRPHAEGWGWVDSTSQVGAAAGGFVVLYVLRSVQRAITDPGSRKRLSFFWDVATFWPRSVHPLGPPSYAERAIPELVHRIRTLAGDDTLRPAAEKVYLASSEDIDASTSLLSAEAGVDSPLSPGPALVPTQRGAAQPPEQKLLEPHRPVLLTGYSQGAPMSVATVAQLPNGVRDKVALLTLAAPVRRLYGRAFPAYFGRDQLETLVGLLKDTTGDVRWRNLVRESDYVGGYAFVDPRGQAAKVDRMIADPPALWLSPRGDARRGIDRSPLTVPMHLHSDWFIDRQTYPHADTLADLLLRPAAKERRVTPGVLGGGVLVAALTLPTLVWSPASRAVLGRRRRGQRAGWLRRRRGLRGMGADDPAGRPGTEPGVAADIRAVVGRADRGGERTPPG